MLLFFGLNLPKMITVFSIILGFKREKKGANPEERDVGAGNRNSMFSPSPELPSPVLQGMASIWNESGIGEETVL